jgi:DNA-binding beta-propeller fold protein YncE
VANDGMLQIIETALIDSGSDPILVTHTSGTPNFLQGASSVKILPDGKRAHAVVSGGLHIIDTATPEVLNTDNIGNSPGQLVFSPDGTRAFVTNSYGSAESGFNFQGQLMVLDTATGQVVDEINLWSLPSSIAISSDGTRGPTSRCPIDTSIPGTAKDSSTIATER